MLENVPENAVVEVDGDRIIVTPAVDQPVTIEVKPGKHGVVVKRGSEVFLAEGVTLEAGKRFQAQSGAYKAPCQEGLAPFRA